MKILQFPTQKSPLHKFLVAIEVNTLEDGSVWWRVEDIRTEVYGDWVKLEYEEYP